MTQHFRWMGVGVVVLGLHACSDSSEQRSPGSSTAAGASALADGGAAGVPATNASAAGAEATPSDEMAGASNVVDAGGATTTAGASSVPAQAGEAGAQSAGGTGFVPSGPLARVVQAFCSMARACCGRAERDSAALQSCEQDASNALEVSATLVTNGVVEMDDAQLSACLAAYERATSSCTIEEVLTACRGVLHGTKAEGDPCRDVLECQRAGGAKICLKIREGAVDPDLGKCTPAPRGISGTPCASSCPLGHDCSTTSSNQDDTSPIALCYEEDGLFCPIGEACAPIVNDGDSCVWDEACGSDGFCLSTCSSRGRAGEACDYNYGCVEGLACEAGHCVLLPAANDDVCAGHPLPLN